MLVKLAIKSYEWTDNSFIKREISPSEREKDMNGNEIVWQWGAERLMNEGAALELLVQHTTIPVPRVISYGKDSNGLTYLEVERIYGLECGDVEKVCRMPDSQKHNNGGKCKACANIAYQNVDHFINSDVLPQLQRLTNNTTGLNGFVLPPPRIVETQYRPLWEPKTSTKEEYVFCHGDLSRHNIMVSPETLKVTYIYDWEHAGFFPSQLEAAAWRMDRTNYHNMFKDTKRIEEEVRLIT